MKPAARDGHCVSDGIAACKPAVRGGRSAPAEARTQKPSHIPSIGHRSADFRDQRGSLQRDFLIGGLVFGVYVLFEPDLQMTAPFQRSTRNRGLEQVATPDRDRPRQTGQLQQFEVRHQRVDRGRQAVTDTGPGCNSAVSHR